MLHIQSKPCSPQLWLPFCSWVRPLDSERDLEELDSALAMTAAYVVALATPPAPEAVPLFRGAAEAYPTGVEVVGGFGCFVEGSGGLEGTVGHSLSCRRFSVALRAAAVVTNCSLGILGVSLALDRCWRPFDCI